MKSTGLSLRTQITAWFVLTLLVLGGLIATALFSLRQIATVQSTVEEDFLNVTDLRTIRANQQAARADVLTMMTVTDRFRQEALRKEIETRARDNTDRLEDLLQRSRDEPKRRALLEEFIGIRRQYQQTREEQFRMIREGKIREATLLSLGIQAERDRRMNTISDELVRDAETRANSSSDLLENIGADVEHAFLAAGILVVAMVVFVFGALSVRLLRPLEAITRVANQVSVGDRGVSVPFSERNDEIGLLSAAIRRMLQDLSGEIDRRDQSERALQEAKAGYQSLVENAPFGIYRAGNDERILSANSALAQMLGWGSLPELVGAHLARDIYQDSRDRARLVRRLQDEGVVRDFEVSWKRRDGGKIKVRLNGRARLDGRGNIESTEMFVEDISRQVELGAMQWQAQKLDALACLAAGINEEVERLLLRVGQRSESLVQGLAQTGDSSAELKLIQSDVRIASRLLRRLASLRRERPLRPQVLDPDAVIADLAETFRRLLGEHIQLELKAGPGSKRLRADRGLLEQILLGLAAHAHETMPHGGTFTVSWQIAEVDGEFARRHAPMVPGRYVHLEVLDSSLGLDAEAASRLFAGDAGPAAKASAAGVGLEGVYGMIKQSNGFIWVESERKKGTRFHIYFPHVKEEAAPAQEGSVPGHLRGNETVLLVERHSGPKEDLGASLDRAGYRVLHADTPAEALHLAESHRGRIHLLLADAELSETTGIDLARSLREKLNIGFQALFLVQYPEDQRLAHFDREAWAFLLARPFSADGLLRRVRQVLDQGRA